MKKGIIIFMSLLLFGCGESANIEKVFKEQRSAACNNDVENFFKYIDMTEFVESVVDGKIENDEQRNDLTKQVKEQISKFLEDGKNTGYCTREIIRIELIDENTARVFTKSGDVSYHELPILYKKKNNKWLMVKFEERKGPIALPAENLISEFRDNAIVATEKYKNTPVSIIGYIMNIDRDESGKVFIAIMPNLFSGIKCYLAPLYSENVTGLKKGQRIEITGVYEKKDTKDVTTLIILKDCTYYKL